MKKILCLALALVMIMSAMVIVASAEVGDFNLYELAEDGDVLYHVDFNSTDSARKFVDGHAKGYWYKTGAEVSADGNSVTFGHTTENLKYTDATEAAEKTEGRAKFWTQLTELPVKGTSLTIEFTLNSEAPVGIYLDCGAGFVINPAENTTSIGEYSNYKMIGDKQIYEGTGAAEQSYLIELSFGTELEENLGGLMVYLPTVYKLYVKEEAGTYRLIREVDESDAYWFEWEPNPGKPLDEGWECLYVGLARFEDDYMVDEVGYPVMSTVSDFVIRKGIDLVEKSEPIPPVENEGENNENEGENNENEGENNENNQNNQNVPNPDDFAPPTAVTEAPETDAQTEAPAEGGCGGSIGFAGVALVTVCATGFAVKRAKKKED